MARENAKLKKLLAEQMLDMAAMKELLSKKMVTPAVKRGAVAHLKAHFGLSDTALRGRLRDLANERRRFGYRRLFVLLRREGEASRINSIYRLLARRRALSGETS